MRLRLVLPRRGRRAGLGGLAAGLALLAGCGGQAAAPPAPPAPAPPPPAPRLAIGIGEADPHLLTPGADVPAPYAAMRDALVALRPAYVRVLVDWSRLQPVPGRPPDLAAPADGCMRGISPCLPWGGLRDTLRAVRALGAEPVLVLYGTPEWAATRVDGCTRRGASSFSRVPDVTAYRGFVRALLAFGAREGIDLPWWAPWNEPNLAGFLDPQRATCDAGGAPVAAGAYAALVRAAEAELEAAPGDQRILLGEAAGIAEPRPKALGAAELVAALPRELVCSAGAWGQHAYLLRIRRGGREATAVAPAETDALLAGVERVLDAHDCPRPVPVWITETGVGDSPGGCRAVGERLEAWERDGRVQAAFQYTFREDPLFPVGLTDPAMTRLYPAYAAWRDRGPQACPA